MIRESTRSLFQALVGANEQQLETILRGQQRRAQLPALEEQPRHDRPSQPVPEPPPPIPRRARSSSSLFDELRSPRALRRSIVLYEILGPPKGLRP